MATEHLQDEDIRRAQLLAIVRSAYQVGMVTGQLEEAFVTGMWADAALEAAGFGTRTEKDLRHLVFYAAIDGNGDGWVLLYQGDDRRPVERVLSTHESFGEELSNMGRHVQDLPLRRGDWPTEPGIWRWEGLFWWSGHHTHGPEDEPEWVTRMEGEWRLLVPISALVRRPYYPEDGI